MDDKNKSAKYLIHRVIGLSASSSTDFQSYMMMKPKGEPKQSPTFGTKKSQKFLFNSKS